MNTFTIKNRPGTKLAKIVSDAAGNEVGYIWKCADTRSTFDSWKAYTLGASGTTEDGVFVGNFHKFDYANSQAEAVKAAVAAIGKVIAA